MKTRSSSTAMGEGATATLNLRPNSHSSLPSLAETPSGPLSVPYRYCLTPPSTAGITEECDIMYPPGFPGFAGFPGFGVRHSSLPVALSSATMIAVPPVAMISRSASCNGHCPLYQEGMVVLYSVTRLLRQTTLPVLTSRQCSTALGSREHTKRLSTAGMVRVMAWLGRISRASRNCQTSLPSASERQLTHHSLFASS